MSKLQDNVVAESLAMRRVMEAVAALSERSAPMLIFGEWGTGRELIARLLHSRRPSGSSVFVAIPAHAPLPACSLSGGPGVGPGPGDDPVSAAAGGTLFIRDIGAVPKLAQKRLVELLPGWMAGGERAVRLIASGDLELARAAAAGCFDRGLFAALAASSIEVPPLRERAEDIPLLFDQFVRGYAQELGLGQPEAPARVYDRLLAYPWPGNVAELKAASRRLVLRAVGERITVADVDAVLPRIAEKVLAMDMSIEDMVASKVNEFFLNMDGYPITGLYAEFMALCERPLLTRVLERTGGNQLRAAEILGLNRNTLRRKLRELGLLVTSRAAARARAASTSSIRDSGNGSRAKASRRTT